MSVLAMLLAAPGLAHESPLTSAPHTLELPDGRTLAWSETGVSQGRPVMFFHGGADSRLAAHLVATAALEAGVRLIAIDRPGFGASTPAQGRTFSSWTLDVLAVADHLGFERFAVMGHSGGGPHALVVAAEAPERVSQVAVVAGAAPREAGARGMVVPFRVGRWLAIHWPWMHRKMLENHRSSLGNPEQFLQQYGRLSAGDKALFETRPDIGRRLVADMEEGYKQGVDAAWHEAQLYYSDWSFSLPDVKQPVHLLYSDADPNAAPGWGPWLEARLPSAELRMVSGEGHISVLVNHAASVFAVLEGEPRGR